MFLLCFFFQNTFCKYEGVKHETGHDHNLSETRKVRSDNGNTDGLVDYKTIQRCTFRLMSHITGNGKQRRKCHYLELKYAVEILRHFQTWANRQEDSRLVYNRGKPEKARLNFKVQRISVVRFKKKKKKVLRASKVNL